MSKELDCIINTGSYILQCGEGKYIIDGEVQKFLEYDVHDSSELEHGGQRTVHRVKNSEQVRDFLTKLGFLNRDDTGGDKVKDFLYLSQVSESSMYLKLICASSLDCL